MPKSREVNGVRHRQTLEQGLWGRHGKQDPQSRLIHHRSAEHLQLVVVLVGPEVGTLWLVLGRPGIVVPTAAP